MLKPKLRRVKKNVWGVTRKKNDKRRSTPSFTPFLPVNKLEQQKIFTHFEDIIFHNVLDAFLCTVTPVRCHLQNLRTRIRRPLHSLKS